MRLLVVLLGLVALQVALWYLVLGLGWPQIGLLLAMAWGLQFISDTIAPKRCKECGGTKWSVLQRDE